MPHFTRGDRETGEFVKVVTPLTFRHKSLKANLFFVSLNLRHRNSSGL